ncbi:MAG: hypothetical protein ACLFUS_13490, partial [Candidatus Sumerlaeia bacterium]
WGIYNRDNYARVQLAILSENLVPAGCRRCVAWWQGHKLENAEGSDLIEKKNPQGIKPSCGFGFLNA